MPSVQVAPPSGIGGLIQGDWGNYQPASDGTYTVDTRDALVLLRQGFAFMQTTTDIYSPPLAPAAATVGRVIASGALSNGTIAISNQPDIMRQVTLENGTGTTAITAGTATVVYIANDGAVQTDTFSLAVALSTAQTQYLSKGVITVSSVTIAGLTGGTSPWVRMSTTAAISLPVAQGSVDLAVRREYDAGATIAIGTLSTTSLATITPTTAPNGTVTYGFDYIFNSPIV